MSPDVFDAATRSRIMASVRGKHTKPEIALRRAVFRAGCRFRLHPRDVPGRPDIAHKGSRVAVFVDGCFWHGCPKHYHRPKSNRDFWDRKLAYNRNLRLRVRRSLRAQEWVVLQFWECEVRNSLERVAARVTEAIRRGAGDV